MVLWRLTEDSVRFGLLEGSCISDERYKSVYYTDKSLFEPVVEFDIPGMVEYKNEEYCVENKIEKVLFYTKNEIEDFLKKI